jgi:hypothetical protein
MSAFNAMLTSLADALLGPLALWPPLATLLVCSLVAGVLAAVVFRYTSNQAAVQRAAERMRAELLAMRLFEDDLRVTLGCLGGVLRGAGLRVAHSLPPTLVLIAPFVLVLIQLGLRYEHRPLAAGETVVVELITDSSGWDEMSAAPIRASDGIVVETPALRDPRRRSIAWRLRAPFASDARAAAGAQWVAWSTADGEITKSVSVETTASRIPAVAPSRGVASFASMLFSPAEPPLPAATGVRGIRVHYPARQTPVLGWDVAWWVTFLVGSIVAAMAFGRLTGVRF